MSEVAARQEAVEAPRRRPGISLVIAVAWRNLGRNRRRTWLTAGGIGFAVALLAFAIAQQVGSYAMMIDNATSLMSGHMQIQHDGYDDDPKIERTVRDSTAVAQALRDRHDVRAVAERAMAFVLVSAGERSFAGQVVGVDPEHEPAVSNIPRMLVAGRFFDSNGAAAEASGTVEAIVGTGLARNLKASVGGEIVLLGTDETGGVAALVARVVGIFSTGQTELDRMLLEVPIGAMRDAFGLEDASHAIVIRASDVAAVAEVGERIRATLGESEALLEWQALMPELEQGIELDRVSGNFFYGLLALIVTFSVVNTFIMSVFERTPEFGMMLAVGMRPWAIIGMLQLEGFWLSLCGVLGGFALATPLIAYTAVVGIPMGDAGAYMAKFHMPERMYAGFGVEVFARPALLMVVATQIAALVPALRIRRINPVEARRAN